MNYSVAELYRQIGNTFRENGADKVVLLKAKSSGNAVSQCCTGQKEQQNCCEMALEIAVDGWFEKEKLQKKCQQLWPEVEITILDLNEDENLGLVDEVMEDGVLL